MPPLLNASAVIQCAHGGIITVVPKGVRPLVGGAPALAVTDFVGLPPAAGCAFNISGVPTPCVVVSVIVGMCPTVMVGGVPAVNSTLSLMTATGFPSMPVASPGQMTVQA